ncbi:MAG: Hsp70 family protein [Myxococcota bacterium]|nr:Hsp70 family protein [Myxococcota bacterium]
MARDPSKPKYVVGIDLGTTNSAVAYADLAAAKNLGPQAVRVFNIVQLVAAGESAGQPLLPSALYLPAAHETTGTSLTMPWQTEPPNYAVGRFARSQGSRTTGRLVTSAKSWLSYAGVDRTAPILPWGAEGEHKVSPVDASAHYLAHIAHAWNHAHPDAPLQDQEIVLTVPASFDDVARTLTLQAAQTIGLTKNLVLLEEPQAAFYDYYRQNSEALTNDRKDQLILVADVGGGTTDLTLIRVRWENDTAASPTVERIAVGDHILLGGDNMDLTLAHLAEKRIEGQAGRLDASTMGALVQSCRSAKERLLADVDDAPSSVSVVLPSRGRRLIGGTRQCDVSRDDVIEAVLDGFVPKVTLTDRPVRGRRSALSAWGLPYASDPAITKHIAEFLDRHRSALSDGVPNALLLNGGVFNSVAIRDRIVDVVRDWSGQASSAFSVLTPQTMDLAVARGATTYGLVKHGIGERIGGGAARSYYVRVRTGKKKKSKRRGVCLLPRSAEPGVSVMLPDRVFNLVLGRPVRFSLFTTTSARGDKPGDLIDFADDQFQALPPIETVLETQEDLRELPVTLRAELGEIGILEVFAKSVDRPTEYRLEFGLRAVMDEPDSPSKTGPSSDTNPLNGMQRQALEDAFRVTYGKARGDVDPREIKRLRMRLEKIIGEPRNAWPGDVCRSIWDLLKPGIRRRRRSERHESTFFHLTGFMLRPGFGDAFDEWRLGELWKIYTSGVHFLKDVETWNAYWIMWRRVAGGLDEAAQSQILADLTPWLRPADDVRHRKKSKLHGREEAMRLVGALERVDPSQKLEWGRWFIEEMGQRESTGIPAWCLGRLGARQPFYGSPHQVIAIRDASAWLEHLLELDWRQVQQAALAAAMIARCTGDRARDVHIDLRNDIAKRLKDLPAVAHLADAVLEVVALEQKDQSRFIGDTLPDGLSLA